MGQQAKDVDVEALQERNPQRGRCLDNFLVMSISFLFVATTALAVGGAMVVMELRSDMKSLSSPPSVGTPQKQTGDASSPAYKVINYYHFVQKVCITFYFISFLFLHLSILIHKFFTVLPTDGEIFLFTSRQLK